MKIGKTAASLLALWLAVSCPSGCAQSPDSADEAPTSDQPGVSDAAQVTAEQPEETSRADVKDTLPDDLDFGGLSVPILYRGGVDEQEILVEELICGM